MDIRRLLYWFRLQILHYFGPVTFDFGNRYPIISVSVMVLHNIPGLHVNLFTCSLHSLTYKMNLVLLLKLISLLDKFSMASKLRITLRN